VTTGGRPTGSSSWTPTRATRRAGTIACSKPADGRTPPSSAEACFGGQGSPATPVLRSGSATEDGEDGRNPPQARFVVSGKYANVRD
jgi:hypothetical protein